MSLLTEEQHDRIRQAVAAYRPVSTAAPAAPARPMREARPHAAPRPSGKRSLHAEIEALVLAGELDIGGIVPMTRHQEIAAALDCAVGTVKVAVSRLRRYAICQRTFEETKP